MFGMFGKKKKELKESKNDKTSYIDDYLLNTAKNLSDLIKKSGKKENLAVIHLTTRPTSDDEDKRSLCAVVAGDPKSISSMLLSAIEEDDDLGKIIIAVGVAACKQNKNLEDFRNGISKVADSDSIRDFLIKQGQDPEKRQKLVAGLSLDEIEKMSEDDIQKFVDKIIEDAERN